MAPNRFKFRAWDKILGRYIPWSPFIGFDNEEYIVEQWTGLTDKNGQEIYEGDIIKDRSGHDYKVLFDDSHGRFDLYCCGRNTLSQSSYFTQVYESKLIEIIGNICENQKATSLKTPNY